MLTVYAETKQAASEAGQAFGGGGIFTIVYLAAMVAIFYFLLIRPQKKRQRELANMIDSLQIKDEVVTAGGIIGKITSIKEDSVTIETSSEKNKITVEKNSISRVLTIHE